jgi:hypothetical protein
MNDLTDGTNMANFSDEELAAWILNDAKSIQGAPGTNNMVSAMRQAAYRLAPHTTPWLRGGRSG